MSQALKGTDFFACILRDVTQKTLHDVTYEIESSKKGGSQPLQTS